MRIPGGEKRKQANRRSSKRVEFVEEKTVEKVKTQ